MPLDPQKLKHLLFCSLRKSFCPWTSALDQARIPKHLLYFHVLTLPGKPLHISYLENFHESFPQVSTSLWNLSNPHSDFPTPLFPYPLHKDMQLLSPSQHSTSLIYHLSKIYVCLCLPHKNMGNLRAGPILLNPVLPTKPLSMNAKAC